MRFLRSRSERAAPTAEEAVALEPIVIFTLAGVTEQSVAHSTERISDRLNRGEAIVVRSAPDGPGHPLGVDDVIAVAVQPQPNPSPNRMARRRHTLELVAPPYRIRGTVHMPPGGDPVRYLRAVPHRWVAVTDATVFEAAGGGYSVEVLLVHMDHVSRA